MTETSGYAAELFDVIAFTWEGGHTLRLKFDDNTERTIDFATILHGPLRKTQLTVYSSDSSLQMPNKQRAGPLFARPALCSLLLVSRIIRHID